MSNASAIHPRGNCEDHGDGEVELSGPCETFGIFEKSSGMLAFNDVAVQRGDCVASVADIMWSDPLSLASLGGMESGLEMEMCLLLRDGDWKSGDMGLIKADVLEREKGMPDDPRAVIL